MKIQIEIQKDLKEPYAIIYTSQITKEIADFTQTFDNKKRDTLVFLQNDKYVLVKEENISRVCFEDNHTVICCGKERYLSKKRLYEIEADLGQSFMRISRTALINLAKVESVEASFGGTMLVRLNDGNKEYISRKYLPEFKKYFKM